MITARINVCYCNHLICNNNGTLIMSILFVEYIFALYLRHRSFLLSLIYIHSETTNLHF